jgi:hypothetical protein
MNTNIKRDKLVYMNFNPNTNPERNKIFNLLKDKVDYEMIGNGGDYSNYLRKLKEYKYIISPPGNGIDCHRNWEAIYCGCIPIVLDSYFTRNVYSDMNVFVAGSYNELLNNYQYNQYNTLHDNMSCEYWKKIILKDGR